MASPPLPKLFSQITAAAAASLAAAASASDSPPLKPQSIPWTHEETVNLIQAYKEKWYSLKRGQLRANQWEEVAVTVAARCGYDYNEPSKSSVQCRHKMEKLRQRYRSEKQRLAGSGGGVCAWQYFDLMDQLDRGPMPISSAQPLASLMPPPLNYGDEDEDDDKEDEQVDSHHRENFMKSRSVNYIQNPRPKAKYGGISGFPRDPVPKRQWMPAEEKEEDDGDDEEVEDEVVVNERSLVSELAAEMKAFAERLIGMESLKMEMMKETERCRLEMENKRIQMILQSQQRIVESIGRAFGSSKRMKMSQDL